MEQPRGGEVTAYTWAWLGWFAYFIVVEGIALLDRREGDTLSEHVWKWLMPERGAMAWRLRRVALLAFMAWLTLHFLTRGQF